MYNASIVPELLRMSQFIQWGTGCVIITQKNKPWPQCHQMALLAGPTQGVASVLLHSIRGWDFLGEMVGSGQWQLADSHDTTWRKWRQVGKGGELLWYHSIQMAYITYANGIPWYSERSELLSIWTLEPITSKRPMSLSYLRYLLAKASHCVKPDRVGAERLVAWYLMMSVCTIYTSLRK